MDGDQVWWMKLMAYTGLAWLGGILGYLMRALDAGVRPSIVRAFVEAGAAAFSGLLFYLLCSAGGVGPEMTGVIVGVAGWLGASVSLRLLETIARKRLGVTDDQRPSVD